MKLPQNLFDRTDAEKRICRNCRKSTRQCFDRFLWEHIRPALGEELIACHYFDSVYDDARITNALQTIDWMESEIKRLRALLREVTE